MQENKNRIIRNISFKKNPISLLGRGLKVNTFAHLFYTVDKDLNTKTLNDFNGKIKIITTFPSLNTAVCSLQVKKFNNELYKKNDEIVYLGISKDLPFAQKLFCDENNISNMMLLSDYKYSSFGINYGLLIKELNLLARTSIIIDKNNILRYMQIAEETGNELNFEDILSNLEKVINEPEIKSIEDSPLNCIQNEEQFVLLQDNMINELLLKYQNWDLYDNNKIIRNYKFQDSLSAKYFVDMINTIAEEQKHHPEITLNFNKVKVALTTHFVNGLTKNDFIMAKIIDELD